MDRRMWSSTNNKRYLILTYIGEFDRIHYPLPLSYEENPEPEVLKRTIKRLRIELDSLRTQVQLKQEKENYQEDSDGIIEIGHNDLQRLQKENMNLLTQLHCLKESVRRHIGYMDNDAAEDDRKRLARDLAICQKKYNLVLSKLDGEITCHKGAWALEKKVEQLQNALRVEKENRKKCVAILTREKLSLEEQVKKGKDAERTMHVRIRELERQIEHLRRRTNLQRLQDLDHNKGPFRRMAIHASLRTSPVSSRENSPAHLHFGNNGSKYISRPGSKENLKIPIYKEYLTRKSASEPSSARIKSHERRRVSPITESGNVRSISPCSFLENYRRKSLEGHNDILLLG